MYQTTSIDVYILSSLNKSKDRCDVRLLKSLSKIIIFQIREPRE